MNVFSRSCLLPGLLLALPAAAERFPFVIPGDDAAPSATDFAWLNDHPAGSNGFVQVRDGHFFAGKERLRLWGVNTCFGANFPAHADAEKVAAHLAKLGINAVRFHHHETAPAPRGLLQPPRDGRRDFDPDAVDRLDYFLDQLHRRGVYANLNLHVGRTFTEAEGFASPGTDRTFNYDKFILYFDPAMRAAFKQFCRDYLGHVNAYRGVRRADDPAVAVVEITNENSFSTKGPAAARKLPPSYRDEFARQWNTWLKQRHGTTDALKTAWGRHEEPPGEVLVTMDGSDPSWQAWRRHDSKERPLTITTRQQGPGGKPDAIRVQIPKAAAQLHEHELSFPDVTLVKDATYTLSFAVRAEKPRRLVADVSQQGPGRWSPLGYAGNLDVGTEWQQVVATFRATEDAARGARICFKFGGSDAGFWLANVVLRRGGRGDPVPAGQTLEAGTIDIPDSGWTAAALAEAKQFMVETEEGFIRDLVQFLKKEVGVKCPITASQVTYHPPIVLAESCDYLDVHAYWQHPHFPGKPWDPRNWTIPNTPMEADPGRNVLFERAVWRLFDKPYTMSEWDIPSPSDYAASTAPFAALVASLQDWDGVFFFDYCSDASGYFRDRISGYFSLCGHPAQLALLGACGAWYRRGDLSPLTERLAGTLDQRGGQKFALSRLLGMEAKRAAPSEWPADPGLRLASPAGTAVCDATDPKKAHVQLNAPAARGVWGLVAGQHHQLGGLALHVGETERNYAAVLCLTLDGQPVETAKRMLLMAVGSAENQEMKWNDTRTSVGADWGHGPTMVNGIPVEVTLPGAVKVRALDGTGHPQATVPVLVDRGASTFQLGPQHKTLWYEILR